ncbi:DUF5682 family protein [Archangium lansingense]|uniref:DUF5682 family protein n=1 Tax=Archangium lansingense TaxID=2995310 RepID=A0ABT3ZU81_9BACT|nr:DUF5682 family protein [Archangium lansinium]MCY1072963.1 DUF5682 family protein [Archangium lansinium]
MTPASPIAQILEELDAGRIEARAHAVLAEPLHWFPVRHHSPAVARHVAQTIQARRPSIVFIEAPSDASELVPHIVDKKTKPPIALFSSYRDDDNTLGLAGIESPAPDVPFKVSVYYPLLSYSPEYVAMREAAALGARVVFIDLPYRARVKSAAERGLQGAPEESGPRQPAPEEEVGPPRDDEHHVAEHHESQPGWEHLAVESSFYQKLADAAGYRSFDECWDALFDVSLRHSDTESFRRDLAYFCAAVRATTSRERMELDGTLLREAHMWSTITRTLAETRTPPEKAMVVCGGFHIFLEKSTEPGRALPPGTVYNSLAPYSYLRTSSDTGYGAGNRAPLYYERLFQHSESDPANAPVAAMVDHVVSVLARGRRDGELLSSADAISVTQHARMLANLRNRSAPILDDVRDALISCCCKGSPQQEGRYLLGAMKAVETGTAVGRVTPALGKLPLLYDFYKALDELDLGEYVTKDRKAKVVLKLQQAEDERRSIFFHRLAQIGIPFAKQLAVDKAGTLFTEEWEVAWTPKVEAALIEESIHGDSVESAALAKLDEELAQAAGSAGAVAERLLRAVNMDLPGMVLRLQASAGGAIDADTRLASLGQALTHLVVLERQAARRRLKKDLLDDLIERCFGRACFAMPNAANVPAEEFDEVVAGVKSLAEVLISEKGADLDRDLFIENARTTLADSKSQRLRGALSGVLTEIRAQSPEDLAADVARFAKALPEEMVQCGDYLSGVMETSKTALMLGADGIVHAIDELLRVASWDQFLMLLPRTRGAFEAVHERSRVSLGDRVAVMYGLKDDDAAAVTKLETSVGAAVKLSEIDARVGEIMKEWDFA